MLRLQRGTGDFTWPWLALILLSDTQNLPPQKTKAREIRKDKIRVESVKGLTKQMITLVK